MSVARLSTVLSGAAAVGLAVAASAAVGLPGQLSLSAHAGRPAAAKIAAEKVVYPLATRRASDKRLYGKRPGTEIKAPCGSTVRAAHPGTAYVSKSRTAGRHLVHVVSSPGQVTTWYGYMRTNTVRSGQYVKAGQKIGTVGHQGMARFCALYLSVTSGPDATKQNPTAWLRRYVGKAVPASWLGATNPSLVVASFNTLGAVHTPTKKYPGYKVRTARQIPMLDGFGVDVAGLQEFEHKQRDAFLAATQGVYGNYPSDPRADSDNSIIWRNSTMEFVSGTTIAVPYFKGHIRQMPVVELRQRSTGLTAYFINVHNPASLPKYGNQSRFRARAIAIERAEVASLRESGRPVFLTGDFNDREKAYCPITAGGLLFAGNVGPVTGDTCTVPPRPWIDWIFASGPVQFSSYTIDTTPKTQKMSDHPIVLGEVQITG